MRYMIQSEETQKSALLYLHYSLVRSNAFERSKSIIMGSNHKAPLRHRKPFIRPLICISHLKKKHVKTIKTHCETHEKMAIKFTHTQNCIRSNAMQNQIYNLPISSLTTSTYFEWSHFSWSSSFFFITPASKGNENPNNHRPINEQS